MSEKAKANYKIIRFEAENIKRLQAAEITPDGALIEITGANENGKSSLLDSIFYALGGTKDIPAEPIRRGEESARVHLDLGTLQITRKFKRKEDGGHTTTLVVETEDGGKSSNPQKILDALIGELTFDPLEFTRMKPKDQFETLRRFVADFDFDLNARDRAHAFEARTEINREVKTLSSQVAGIAVPAGTPETPIDETALVNELQQVGEHNAAIESDRLARKHAADVALRHRVQADDYERQGVNYRKLADEVDAEAARLRGLADSQDRLLASATELPALKDATEIRARIEEARQINRAVSDLQRRNSLLDQAAEKAEEAASLTAEIDRLDADKAKAISNSKMPVDGIGFAEDYITLDGLPFNQASSARQLRTSIAIAMEANPRLRILIVRDGALLDSESMQVVAEMAEANDTQVWIETVNSGRPSAIVIEDGRVRGEEAQKVAAE